MFRNENARLLFFARACAETHLPYALRPLRFEPNNAPNATGFAAFIVLHIHAAFFVATCCAFGVFGFLGGCFAPAPAGAASAMTSSPASMSFFMSPLSSVSGE